MQCGLTCRSNGHAEAGQPGRPAHRFIMRRAAGLPRLGAPLNSTLGVTHQPHRHPTAEDVT